MESLNSYILVAVDVYIVHTSTATLILWFQNGLLRMGGLKQMFWLLYLGLKTPFKEKSMHSLSFKGNWMTLIREINTLPLLQNNNSLKNATIHRWEFIRSDCHLIGYILDPRYAGINLSLQKMKQNYWSKTIHSLAVLQSKSNVSLMHISMLLEIIRTLS